MRLKPLEDRVIVKPSEAPDKTPGGILLPDMAKEKPTRGKVLAVGPGKRQNDGTRWAPLVAVGDEVLYSRYGGNETEIDDMKVRILHESDIVAVVEG